ILQSSFLPLLFFIDSPPIKLYTLSLHDALPILPEVVGERVALLQGEVVVEPGQTGIELQVLLLPANLEARLFDRVAVLLQRAHRSEEHTSELQSRGHLVCRLLLEKKKKEGNLLR